MYTTAYTLASHSIQIHHIHLFQLTSLHYFYAANKYFIKNSMLGENVTPAREDDLLQHVTLRIKGPSRIELRTKNSSQFEGDRYVGVYA